MPQFGFLVLSSSLENRHQVPRYDGEEETIEVFSTENLNSLTVKHYKKNRAKNFLIYTLPSTIFEICIKKGPLVGPKGCIY